MNKLRMVLLTPHPLQSDLKKLVVVRDPFKRALSGYRDKLENYQASMFINTMFADMILPHR